MSDTARTDPDAARDVSGRPLRSAVRDVDGYAIAALDPDGTIASWNAGCVRIYGYSGSEIIGEPLSTLGSRKALAREEPWRMLERAAEAGRFEGETLCRRRDGSTCWTAVTLTPIRDDGELRGFVMVTQDITERKERRRRLRRQRDELEMLDGIHHLIEEIIQGLVVPTTREELEAAVCERLTGTPFYTTAWIGERSVGDGRLVPRAGTGREAVRGMLAEVAPDAIEDCEMGETLLRGGTFVSRRIDEDPLVPEPVKRFARDRGERSGIALPLMHGETIYGVLVVHSDRPDAFDGHERTSLETLAKTIGFAIYALKQERLLLADTVVELELRAAEPAAFFATLAAECRCRCRVDDIVRGPGESLLHFLTVEGVRPGRVREVIEAADVVEDYRMIARYNGKYRFEIRVKPSDFLNHVVDVGAVIRTAVADPDENRVVIEAASDDDLDELVDVIRAHSPDWTLARKRTVDRPVRTTERMGQRLEERLTEKQLTALRTAYFAGYYDFPRKSTGQEVAADLHISGSTLFQHLQAAERKLIENYLDLLSEPSPSR
ncbi:bacterio-opsin activator domain-containing protein [Halomarina halobia]|uniref:Bacterio-opsin activator domain-containing protein n=1 Tax=Halomarina halobia TaxID=3033386 RepID=A0ABD6A9U5_9EURY|nr:bacterio-opsin activator domain-containing protein [Halomarina sp. PSR21]